MPGYEETQAATTPQQNDLKVVVAVLANQHAQTQATLQRIEQKVDSNIEISHEQEKRTLRLELEHQELTRRFEEHVALPTHPETGPRLLALEQQFTEFRSMVKWLLGVLGTATGGLLLAVLKEFFGL